ncbi:MAG: hypothetical protein JSW20_12185 [Nitrospiraceae bacterium]|nr:MAG: hypothetical protein JSW20_12185 [Nitrospiraceae bacterium]
MFFKNKIIRYIFIGACLICISYPVVNYYVTYQPFSDLLVRNTEKEAIRVGHHLSNMFFSKQGVLTEDKSIMELNDKSNNVIHDFNLMKLKIFSPSGETVYSTSAADIGKVNKHDYYHNIVAHGRPFTKVVQKDSKSLEGQVVSKDVVETYVPIMLNGKFIGAFEIYYDITESNNNLKKVMNKTVVFPFVMNLLFLLVLTLILIKQDRILIKEKEQEEGLRALNAQLESEIMVRNNAENEILQFAEKLEQSNKDLQDFAHIASHDLQEPLRKVISFGNRLHSKYADVLGDQGLDYLNRMQKASMRMQNLIEGLLTYSRVTSKAQPFEEVNLSTLSKEVISDLEVRIDELGGRVEVDDLPVLKADPLQMRQLFQNLIGNALKFHKKDEAPVVKITGMSQVHEDGYQEQDSPLCQITFEDNGIGFEDKYAERIFGVFQRLHGKSEFEGTGIGLSVCKKIVDRHGGRIEAKSTPGVGTKFIISLPVANHEGESGEE